jgi:hypothetical protein
MDRRTALLSTLAATLPERAAAQSLAELGGAEATAALREVLAQAAASAVETLGRTDGFLGDPRVRIPLPDAVRRVERLLRATGAGPRLDELVVAMNRAAEAAVPEARGMLADAVKSMGIDDAKAILSGGDDAATRYFRERTADGLEAKLQPLVRRETERVNLVQRYDRLAADAVRLRLARQEDVALERHVTRRALDGLYLTIADAERAIRRDPAAAVGRAARRVLAAVRG